MTGRKRSGGIHAATRAPAVCSFFFVLFFFVCDFLEHSTESCHPHTVSGTFFFFTASFTFHCHQTDDGLSCELVWSLHSANLWSCNSPIWHGDHCKPCHNMNQNYDPRLILSWSWIFSVTGSGSCPVFHKKVKHKRLGYFLLEWTVLEPLWTFDLTTSFKINLGNGVIVVAGGFWRVGNREPLFPVAPRFSTRPQ